MSRGRKNSVDLHDGNVDLVVAEASPEVDAAGHEIGDVVAEALLDLGAEDRLIVLLSEVDGFDAPEVADRVGLSPGAVRTRLTRIRQRLRERLRPFLADSNEG
jgi:RNA polymerase sigma-70 factor (ECF subfamily)